MLIMAALTVISGRRRGRRKQLTSHASGAGAAQGALLQVLQERLWRELKKQSTNTLAEKARLVVLWEFEEECACQLHQANADSACDGNRVRRKPRYQSAPRPPAHGGTLMSNRIQRNFATQRKSQMIKNA
eukprot:2208718-Amphidinium_carterae.1